MKNLRVLSLIFFTILMGGGIALSQSPATIKLNVNKNFGESLQFWVKTMPSNQKIKVDWGNGTFVEKEIPSNAALWERKVEGALQGSEITIIGNFEELDFSDLGITKVIFSEIQDLKVLTLNNNELTSEGFTFETGAPSLEDLFLNNNKIGRLDIRPFSQLKNISINENENFGALLIGENNIHLETISIEKGDLSKFSTPIVLDKLYALNLSENSLLSFDPQDKLPALKDLNLNGNWISTIKLEGHPLLEKLDLTGNKIESIDLSLLPNLLNLYVSKNNIRHLSVEKCPNLTDINCSENQISSLNVSNISKLISLNCSKNQIKGLDLRNNIYLSSLRASDNLLSVLDLANNNRLRFIDLRNNPNMTACSFNYLFSTMWPCAKKSWSTNLFLVGSNAENADGTTITSEEYNWKPDISFSGTASCEKVQITLKGNGWENIKLLTHKNVQKNEYMDITNGTEIIAGSAIYFSLKESAEKNGVKGILVNGKEIKSSPFTIYESSTIEVLKEKVNLFVLGTKPQQDLSFTLTSMEASPISIDWGDGIALEYPMESGKIKRFDNKAIGNQIKIKGNFVAADFNSYPGTGTWDNHFTSFDVKGMENIQSLELYMNPIQEINLSAMPKLEVLDLSYTAISSLDLSKQKDLKQLLCSGNQLQHLDLSQNLHLEKVDLHQNLLSSVDFSNNHELASIDLQNNNLSSINLSGLGSLTELKLSLNKITSVDISKNLFLEKLLLSHNPISSLDISANQELILLYLEGCQIKALDLSHNPRLNYVNIANNGLSACQLNDIFYTLPIYKKIQGIKIADNVSLRLSTAETDRENQVSGSATSIATYKLWKVDTQGNDTECPNVYITLNEHEKGKYQILDENKQEILSGSKVKRGTKLSVSAQPADQYKFQGLKVNGQIIEGNLFTITQTSWIDPVFKPLAIEYISDNQNLYQINDGILKILVEFKKASVFDMQGYELIRSENMEGMDVSSLNKGVYILKIEQEEKAKIIKLIL